MEQQLQHLLRQLALVGYRPHEITQIVRASSGGKTGLVGHLERYERLGQHFLNNYSQ